jgi:hypothetical protein
VKKDTRIITIDDLRPKNPEVYRNIAYGMTHGDMVSEDLGVHGRRSPFTGDTSGRTKLDTYRASSRWDDPWFHEVVQDSLQHPHCIPPSRETRIRKDSGGTRPIGDPAEQKRTRATYIREVIEDRLEARLLPCQLGGRPLRWLHHALGEHVPCIRKGATPQDQMATLAQQYVHDGYRVVLCMDLANAYGLLPKQAVIPELRAAGISQGAAEYIWRHARLDAVSKKTGKRVPYSKYLGVEQGGVLSGLLLNLGLAPILGVVLETLDVKILGYVDDIYIFCRSVPDAEEAFNLFKQESRARGFKNVRGLQSPAAPVNKASTIQIVTDDNPLVVLKRYLVSPSYIGMTQRAIGYLKEQMAVQEISGSVTYQGIRNISGQQAPTRKGIRISVPEYLSSPQRGRDIPHPLEEPSEGITPKDEDGQTFSLHREREGTIHHMVPMVQAPFSTVMEEEDANPTEGTLPPTRAGYHDHDRSGTGRCKQADGTVVVNDGNREPTEGDAQGAGRSEIHSPTDLSRSVSVTDPEVADLIRQKKPTKLGTRIKDTRLDLRGLAEVLGPDATDHDIRLAVGGLLRAARSRRVVQLVVDQRDMWTSIEDILGNHRDTIYERMSINRMEDGAVLLTLRKRKPVIRERKRLPPPPMADVVVYRIRRSPKEIGTWDLRIREEGTRPRWESVPGGTIAAGGSPSALVAFLGKRNPSTVAVVAMAELRMILIPQLSPCRPGVQGPVLVPLRLAQDDLLRNWAWVRAGGDWIVGTVHLGNLSRRMQPAAVWKQSQNSQTKGGRSVGTVLRGSE